MTDEPIRILLVDDDVDTRSMYAEVFRMSGFDVREANDGLEGLEMANQIVPQVVLAGIIMPRMDGFQFVEGMKKNVATASVPVAFLSHLGRQEDEEKARAVGVKDFIVRDMTTPVEVVTRMKSLLESSDFSLPFDIHSAEAGRLFEVLGMDGTLPCMGGAHPVLRLRLRDKEKRIFEAELICQ
jgi:CheY-like chemotaxis protein